MKIFFKILISILVIGLVLTNSFTVLNFHFNHCENYDYIIKSDNTVEIIFYENINDTNIIVPEYIDGKEVTSIASKAYNCQKASSIIIPNSIISTSENSFYNCDNVKSLKWPAGCDDSNSFANLSNLQLLSISYGSNGFMKDYQNNYLVPWFQSNESIDTLIIEDGVRYLGDYSFALLKSLKELTLSSNIEAIGKYCFYQSYLPDIELPNTLQSIKEYGLSNSNIAQISLNRNISYLGNESLSKNNIYTCFNNSYSYSFIKNNNLNSKILNLDFLNNKYQINLSDHISLKIDDESLQDNLINYYSSDQNVCTINQNGEVKTLNKGVCDIYANYKNGFCKTTIEVSSKNENQYAYRMINVNDKYDLKTESINEIDFSKNDIEYFSRDKKIAKVSSDGIVKGLKQGQTTIEIKQNNKIVEFIFDIGMYVKEISTARNIVAIKRGASFDLNAEVSPKKADNKYLTYISDNNEIAVVNPKGKITGLKNGSCNVIVLSNDGSAISKTIKVNVSSSSIESALDIYIVAVDKKTPLRIKTNDKSDLLFVSSDKNIAYVENGYIYGVNEGKCYINVYNTSNTAYYSVEVACYNNCQMGIDISEWNGRKRNKEIFDKVKNDGIEFVYIRAAYRDYYKDPIFEDNYKYAKEAGLNVGAYHYIYATNTKQAVKEAKWMIKVLNGKQFEYPIMLDIEASVHKNLSKEKITNIIDAYCQTLEQAGYATIVYSYISLLNKYDGNRDCHVANWGNDYPNSFNKEFKIWQYTSSGSINGFSGRVDLDISFFDYPTYIKENHLNGY